MVVLDNNVIGENADRMDYNTGNCSLCMNKLDETDNGMHEMLFIYNKQLTLSKAITLFVEGKSFIFIIIIIINNFII